MLETDLKNEWKKEKFAWMILFVRKHMARIFCKIREEEKSRMKEKSVTSLFSQNKEINVHEKRIELSRFF